MPNGDPKMPTGGERAEFNIEAELENAKTVLLAVSEVDELVNQRGSTRFAELVKEMIELKIVVIKEETGSSVVFFQDDEGNLCKTVFEADKILVRKKLRELGFTTSLASDEFIASLERYRQDNPKFIDEVKISPEAQTLAEQILQAEIEVKGLGDKIQLSPEAEAYLVFSVEQRLRGMEKEFCSAVRVLVTKMLAENPDDFKDGSLQLGDLARYKQDVSAVGAGQISGLVVGRDSAELAQLFSFTGKEDGPTGSSIDSVEFNDLKKA